jgi:putative CocE/NonD family hydrolase
MRRGMTLVAVAVAALTTAGSAARAATVSQRVAVSDGTQLQTTLTSADPAVRRPVVVEFTPYGRSGASFTPSTDFARLLVQVRGTGDSSGRFDAFGPRMQQDLADVLHWACQQPWSDGRLGLMGFSASAIAVYNALHLPLPCVKAAVLKSGTFELYRDLLVPGGISNLVPGAVVLGGIGGIALSQADGREPAATPDALAGQVSVGLDVVRHPVLDDFWRNHGFRGDVNHLPILMIDGFFDVESRGAFQAFQALRENGAHLRVTGGHDAAPKGTDGGLSATRAWFDRYLRGVRNGVDRQPKVQLWLADGDRKTYAAGRFVRRNASDWPVPRTRWRAWNLDATRSGTARSLNDGTLTRSRPAAPTASQPYPAITSVLTKTDVPNAAIIDAAGLSALTDRFPLLSDMRGAESLGLSYTSAPLGRDIDTAGPAALDVTLSTTTPGAPIWAVLSDVGPDGVPHPLTVGRLSTDFPGVDRLQSLTDPLTGAIVQPYGRYDMRQPASPGIPRRYHVELWPIGNRFRRGHRLRLHLVGASVASAPLAPAVNTVTVGGPEPSRLLLPVLPAELKRSHP